MKEKLIAIGAEAKIIIKKNKIIKKRLQKRYRYPELDNKLRTFRTRQEARLIEKASKIISVPKIIAINEKNKTIEMENIKGKKLSIYLDKLKNKIEIAKKIGSDIARIHDSNIIHGDLTTSNLIYNQKNKSVYFIDFGLGFHSARIEDKAVDLHVLKESLEAKHPKYVKMLWKTIISSYIKSTKKSKEVINRLNKVEKRGRYKSQY